MAPKINRRTFAKTMAAGTLGLLSGFSFNNQFNIIIKNGMIIDGTGRKAFQRDIGIIGDKIAALVESMS